METLTGRLKWERIGDGIRVDYRIANDSAALRASLRRALITGLWCFPLFVFLMLLLNWVFPSHTGEHIWLLPIIATLGMLLGQLMNIYSVHREMRMSPSVLEVKYRNWPLPSKRYSYEMRQMHNLRFAGKGTNYQPCNGDREGELQFDSDSRTQYCFVGITRDEAEVLIEKLMEVHPLPKYLPVAAEDGTGVATA